MVDWVANCKEYITLWASPEGKDAIVKIPAGEGIRLKQWQGKYALVSYGEKEGYVLSSYIMPENAEYFSQQLSVVKPTQVYSYEQMCSDISALKKQYPDALQIPSLTIEIGCLSTPLEEREIYCIFARNCYVLPAIARWICQ